MRLSLALILCLQEEEEIPDAWSDDQQAEASAWNPDEDVDVASSGNFRLYLILMLRSPRGGMVDRTLKILISTHLIELGTNYHRKFRILHYSTDVC